MVGVIVDRERLLCIAKKYGLKVIFDSDEAWPNTAHYSSGLCTIHVGKFDCELFVPVAVFHEIGHHICSKKMCGRTHYMSTATKEGAAWEAGLSAASRHGFQWDYYSKEMAWARAQFATYFNKIKLDSVLSSDGTGVVDISFEQREVDIEDTTSFKWVNNA